MAKKNQKKRFKKLDKKTAKKLKNLDKQIRDNKYVSREEFLVNSFTKSFRRYYDSLSPDRQNSLVQYIIRCDDHETQKTLVPKERFEPEIKMKKCSSLSEVLTELKNVKKREKKARKNKIKNIVEDGNGILHLLNPEAYDQVRMGKKAYRKEIQRLANETFKGLPLELDCTLKGYRDQLLKSDKVNAEVMESFWNSHGY